MSGAPGPGRRPPAAPGPTCVTCAERASFCRSRRPRASTRSGRRSRTRWTGASRSRRADQFSVPWPRVHGQWVHSHTVYSRTSPPKPPARTARRTASWVASWSGCPSHEAGARICAGDRALITSPIRAATLSTHPDSSESGNPRKITSVSATPSRAQARRASPRRTSASSAGVPAADPPRAPSLTTTTVTGVPAARLRRMATAQPRVSSSGCGATTRHGAAAIDAVMSIPRRSHTRRQKDRAGTITRSRPSHTSAGTTRRATVKNPIPNLPSLPHPTFTPTNSSNQ